MLYPYTCTLCNATWSATSPHFKESHLASDEHRHNKNAADRAALLEAAEEALEESHIDMDTAELALEALASMRGTLRLVLAKVNTP